MSRDLLRWVRETLVGRRWPARILGILIGTGAGPTVGWLASDRHVTVSVSAGIMLGGGLAALPRKGIQWRLGYHKRLPALMVFDTALIVGWITAGFCFLRAPPAPEVLMAVSALLWPSVMLSAAATLNAAEDQGLPRVSDIVNSCDSVVRLRSLFSPLDRVIPFGFFDRRWDDVPEKGKASSFVVVTAGALLIAALASAATLAGLGPTEKASRPAHTAPPNAQLSGAATTPGAGQSKPPQPDQPALRYDVLCGNRVKPGDPAPPSEAAKLYSLWLGGPQIDGRGAGVAGCAEEAHSVAGHSEIWWAVGKCGDRVLSLGVSAPNIPPEMMLGQVARFALPFAEAGGLTGASPRIRIGHGDFQVVHTDQGDYVLIRDQLTDDSAASQGVGGECAPLGSGASRYVVVRPGALALWMQVANDGWVWPESASGGIAFRNTSGEIVATAACVDDQTCQMSYGGRVIQGGPNRRIDSGVIRELAPPETR